MASFESIWIRYIDVGNRFGNFRKQTLLLLNITGSIGHPHFTDATNIQVLSVDSYQNSVSAWSCSQCQGSLMSPWTKDFGPKVTIWNDENSRKMSGLDLYWYRTSEPKVYFRTCEKTLLNGDFREGNPWISTRCCSTIDFVWEGWTLKCLLLCKSLEFGTFDSEDYILLTWQSSRHFTRLETCFFGKKNDENLRNCKFQILHFARQLKKFNFDLTKSIQQDEHDSNF